MRETVQCLFKYESWTSNRTSRRQLQNLHHLVCFLFQTCCAVHPAPGKAFDRLQKRAPEGASLPVHHLRRDSLVPLLRAAAADAVLEQGLDPTTCISTASCQTLPAPSYTEQDLTFKLPPFPTPSHTRKKLVRCCGKRNLGLSPFPTSPFLNTPRGGVAGRYCAAPQPRLRREAAQLNGTFLHCPLSPGRHRGSHRPGLLPGR